MLLIALLVAVVVLALVARAFTNAGAQEPAAPAGPEGREGLPREPAAGPAVPESSGPEIGDEAEFIAADKRALMEAPDDSDEEMEAEALEPVGIVRDRASGERGAFVRILSTSDTAFLLVARSVLAAAGIPSTTQGEGLQDLLGLGRLPIGVNLATGPMHVSVPRSFEDRARAALLAPTSFSPELPADGDEA